MMAGLGSFMWLVFALPCIAMVGFSSANTFIYPMVFLENREKAGTHLTQMTITCVDKTNNCNVIMTFSIDGTSQTSSLPADDTMTVNLDPGKTRLNGTTIEDKGISLSSDGELAIMGYDSGTPLSSDIFIPREHTHLGRDYVAMTYCQSNKKCLIGILAVEPNVRTTVTIVFPDSFTGTVNYNGTTYTGGDILCVHLSYLQTFQLVSLGVLTGTIVMADHAIAVVSGADRTKVILGPYINHLSATVPPISYWGRQYVLVRTDPTKTDYVTVIASRDNTVIAITCNGVTTATIARAYQDHYGFTMDCDLCEISSVVNILVGHYPRRMANNPGLYYPLPMNHFTQSYVISALPQGDFSDCDLVVIASHTEPSLMIDGVIRNDPWVTMVTMDHLYLVIGVSGYSGSLRIMANQVIGGHLICTSGDSTRVAPLMPATYASYINSTVYKRDEDSQAVESCQIKPEMSTFYPTTDDVTTGASTTPDVTTIGSTVYDEPTIVTTNVDVTTTVTTNDDVTTIVTTNDVTTITTNDDVTTTVTTNDDVTTIVTTNDVTTVTTNDDVTTTVTTNDDVTTTVTTNDDVTTTVTTNDDVTTKVTTNDVTMVTTNGGITTMTTPSVDETTIVTTNDDVTAIVITTDGAATNGDVTTMSTTEAAESTTTENADVTSMQTTNDGVTDNELTTMSTIGLCYCTCVDLTNSSYTFTSHELLTRLYKLRTSTSVLKNETSLWRRKLTCAHDPRPSATAVGATGTLLLCCFILIICLSDIFTLFANCCKRIMRSVDRKP